LCTSRSGLSTGVHPGWPQWAGQGAPTAIATRPRFDRSILNIRADGGWSCRGELKKANDRPNSKSCRARDVRAGNGSAQVGGFYVIAPEFRFPTLLFPAHRAALHRVGSRARAMSIREVGSCGSGALSVSQRLFWRDHWPSRPQLLREAVVTAGGTTVVPVITETGKTTGATTFPPQ